jgi:hypothetical protein
MIYFITLILWIVYSSLFGYTDAWYWYSANVGKYTVKDFKFKDLHPHFFWTRSIVGSITGYVMCQNSLLDWFLIMICLGLIFPFFHNGFYYLTRHKIDSTKYPLGFRDMSTTSISNINFTFSIRLCMFLVGLFGVFMIYFL